MTWISEYVSPLGTITLACDDEALVGLWFNGQRYFGSVLPKVTVQREHPLFAEAGRWLDIYFPARNRGFCRRCAMIPHRSVSVSVTSC